MTQFIKKISTVNTNERKAVIPNFDYKLEMVQEPFTASYRTDTKMEFTGKFSVWAWTPSDGASLMETRRIMLEKFRRSVYGDVEDSIVEIMIALHQRDEKAAMKLCEEAMKILKEV